MKKLLPITMILLFILLHIAYAEEPALSGQKQENPASIGDDPEPGTSAPQEEEPELTREDILERINTILEYRVDVREAIPGVQLKQSEPAPYIEYNGVRVDDLDEETLMSLLAQVNQQINLKNIENTQRMQRQLKNLQNIQNINRTQRMLRQLRQINQNTRRNKY